MKCIFDYYAVAQARKKEIEDTFKKPSDVRPIKDSEIYGLCSNPELKLHWNTFISQQGEQNV